MKFICYVLTTLVILVILGLMTGCRSDKNNMPTNTPTPDETESTEIPPSASVTDYNTPGVTPEIVTDGVIESLLQTMTLEEKVGQLFIVAFRKDNIGRSLHHLNENTKQQIQNYKLGGVILFSENIDSIPQTVKLIEDMQNVAKTPMFISVDEEGGRVSRLGKSNKMHSTKLPSNKITGSANDPNLAYEVGKILGAELSTLGFNMNFAPVADINTNRQNPVIGDRAFGSNTYDVSLMVSKEVQGIQEHNICAVLKHFPGHGDTSLDTHLGQVVVNHDMRRLEQVEFVPFKSGIDAGADGVMAAHIMLPGITEESVPASLSKEILTDILRNKLNYNGLIITDSLEMKAISSYWTPSEAALKAFTAGADIILMPASLDKAYNSILDAVSSGEIPESRLDESVKRILDIKLKRKILERYKSGLNPDDVLGSEEHLNIVKKIKEKAGS
jgi:beta-N-acetylhexosaminidase